MSATPPAPLEETKTMVSPGSMLDDRLKLLGQTLQHADGRKALVIGCFGLFRRVLRWGMLSSQTLLVLHCVLMRWVGERNLFFGFCLYLPPLMWLLPALALGFLCLLVWEWRGLLIGIFGTAIAYWGFYDFKVQRNEPVISDPSTRSAETLVVLTNNRGQHANTSMKPFKNLVKPDIMVFQEAGSVSARYLADPEYSEFKHGRDMGEFSIVSKYPIQSAESVVVEVRSPLGISVKAPPATERHTIAAKFLIDFNGQPIVIYNVHLPTPRDTLRYYFRGAFLYGLIGIPGTPFGEKRAINQQGWDMRTEMIKKLIERAKGEKKPAILAGDFNMPSQGWNHSLVSRTYLDSHEEAGTGFGFTFPGVTGNPLAFGGPWMRIDYIFAAPESWTFVTSVAEQLRASQHRAIAAQMVLRPPSSKSD